MTAVNSTSVNAAKQWIGRIVVGTIGAEIARGIAIGYRGQEEILDAVQRWVRE